MNMAMTIHAMTAIPVASFPVRDERHGSPPRRDLPSAPDGWGENFGKIRDRQEASRRKDEFLAMLGHEMRNPLEPIRNAMQIVRLKGADEPDHELAEMVGKTNHPEEKVRAGVGLQRKTATEATSRTSEAGTGCFIR